MDLQVFASPFFVLVMFYQKNVLEAPLFDSPEKGAAKRVGPFATRSSLGPCLPTSQSADSSAKLSLATTPSPKQLRNESFHLVARDLINARSICII